MLGAGVGAVTVEQSGIWPSIFRRALGKFLARVHAPFCAAMRGGARKLLINGGR